MIRVRRPRQARLKDDPVIPGELVGLFEPDVVPFRRLDSLRVVNGQKAEVRTVRRIRDKVVCLVLNDLVVEVILFKKFNDEFVRREPERRVGLSGNEELFIWLLEQSADEKLGD
jgi:hypothetical protein